MIQGSANGFLVLRDLSLRPHRLSICNPITREYMEIHSPPEFDYTYPQVATFGFGVSRITGRHKVVRVFHGREIPECHVYTLGTGSWRSVASSAPLRYGNGSIGAFLSGNLHWLAFDSSGKPWISCFDLETELFSIISPPPPLQTQQWPVVGVFAFEDKLCVCDNSSEDEIVVWLEKEYGDEKSWSKEFVIAKTEDFIGECDVRPIKMFKDGDVSMAWGDFFLYHYSSKTKAVSEMRMFEARGNCALDLIPYTCTFLSLKTFGMENVNSF